MHALFVSYGLRGATAAEHAELCAQLSPAVAAVPQLVSHTWLSNETSGRYGAFYVFQSKPAFDAFIASELYDTLREHRTVDDLTASDFSIEPAPTARTARGPARPPHEPSVR
jgi:Putative mono-oxygenase ydhR